MKTTDAMLPMLEACKEKLEAAQVAASLGFEERAQALHDEAYNELEAAQARELPILMAAHDRWTWVPGMLVARVSEPGEAPGDPYRMVCMPDASGDYWLAYAGHDGGAQALLTCSEGIAEYVPVIDDPATLGALWSVLCAHVREHRPTWGVALRDTVVIWHTGTGSTLFDGPLVAALLLAWDVFE